MRKWVEVISPKQANNILGCYDKGVWLKEMDRAYFSDDGYEVTTRLIETEVGKVEHACISYHPDRKEDKDLYQTILDVKNDGSFDIPWNIKQEIKNEVFGKDRVAIEVFPAEKNLVDAADCYHLWIMPKNYKMPFGISHRDVQCKAINRGVPSNPKTLLENTAKILGKEL